MDFDDGYAEILIPEDLQNINYIVREEEDGSKHKIHLIESGETIYRDLTIEQGNFYSYYLYQANEEGTFVGISEPTEIETDFEDMFLSDSTGRQLKLRFNPTVNQYKSTILESKTDTIGGKYPVIFRNGNVRYKEFSIGGLISFLIDDNGLFLGLEDNEDFLRTSTNSESITSSRTRGRLYRKERNFREEVEKWLTDGKIKLFRSQSEGNMLVRLMNVNMTPYNNTGRLVYSFTANAVEECGHEYEDLLKNKFYEIGGIINV